MKYAIVVIAIVFLCSLAYGDLMHVDVHSVFTAGGVVNPSTCAGCTQTFDISFEYDPSLLILGPHVPPSSALPGTLYVASSGFLGSFTTTGVIMLDAPWFMGFSNGSDEIDLWIGAGGAVPTVSVIGMSIWRCWSAACTGGYGFPAQQMGDKARFSDMGNGEWYLPTYQAVSERAVALPEPSALALLILAVPGLGLVRSRIRDI